jgi:hypothetical protein
MTCAILEIMELMLLFILRCWLCIGERLSENNNFTFKIVKLNNTYDWYDLPEDVRHEYWLKSEHIFSESRLYIPVLWSNKWCNYGQKYGLLYFPKIYGGPYDKSKYKGTKWFGVRVFSPDDWDLDLDIIPPSNSTNAEKDIQYDYLLKITKEYVNTGGLDAHELFNEIGKDFTIKYPQNKINRGY